MRRKSGLSACSARLTADLRDVREHARDHARAGDRPDGEQRAWSSAECISSLQARRGGRAGGVGDLAEDLAEARRAAPATIRGPVMLIASSPATSDDGAAEVGAARDLPLLARVMAVLRGRLLGAVVVGHAQRHVQQREGRPTRPRAASEIQPARNGSDAATTSSATATLTGKPTANTFSCGTTRETMPNATSVISSATQHRRGDLERRGEHRWRTACSAPPTSEAICGPRSSGTSCERARRGPAASTRRRR